MNSPALLFTTQTPRAPLPRESFVNNTNPYIEAVTATSGRTSLKDAAINCSRSLGVALIGIVTA